MNNVCLMGRLTADPELRYTQTNKAVTSFTVAVDRMKDGADFLPVVAWEKTAEHVCKYFTKGKLIAVTGSLQSRSYENKDGQKRSVVEVLAQKVDFCGDREKSQEARQEPDIFPDDLPFN